MQIQKISFQNYKNNLCSTNNQKVNFYGNEKIFDKEKKDYSKYIIGGTALTAGILIATLGAKGHLGKSIQKLFGTAESVNKSKPKEIIAAFSTVEDMEKWLEYSDFKLIEKDKKLYLQTKNNEPVVDESLKELKFKTKEDLCDYLFEQVNLSILTNQKDAKGKNIIKEIALPQYIIN